MLSSDLIYGLIASLNKSEYSVEELKYLTKPFNISESNLRTALFRMVSRGLLLKRRTGKQAFYYRSVKGKQLGLNVALRFKNPDWSGWDNEWWGLCFSISETDKKDRYRIRKKLVNYHFKPLYSGFWILPVHPGYDITASLNTDYINKNARLIQFKPVIPLSKEFIHRLWNLDTLNKGFNKGIRLIQKYDDSGSKSPEQAFVEMMQTGGEIVKILFTDPLLPDSYIPDNWKADDLRNKFNSFIKQTREASRLFWEKIF